MPLSQPRLGEGLFLLFGLVLAWASSADAATGTTGVPSVDGVGEPSASAADRGVRLGELVGADCGRADAEPFGHVGDAQVFGGHSPSSHFVEARARIPAKHPSVPAGRALPPTPSSRLTIPAANAILISLSFIVRMG
nr:MAG TPA: hypothetical protein [Caudoviricetes sp.]DAZ29644.1 MAG TPA: hypothetical protein [Caudoviricetes sp.]